MKLWLVVGGGGEIMAGRRQLCMVMVKLQLVLGGLGCWQQNYGWLWVDMDGHRWSWVVARFSNTPHKHVSDKRLRNDIGALIGNATETGNTSNLFGQ